jgi:hypothetical protein
MHPTTLQTSIGAVALTAALLLPSCKDKPDPGSGSPPAPPASAAAPSRACDQGGGSIKDPAMAAVFPRAVSGYCIDPHGEYRSFGEGSPKPLDAVCTEAFNGACDQYKSFGLKSVAEFHYVHGGGSSGAVEVVASKFASAEGAYGMFTSRVVGDHDPAQERFPRDMKLPGAAAQGTGSAYLWKGQLFVELTYTNETETPKQLAESSSTVLNALGAEIAAKLPGTPELPLSAAALPTEKRLPLGILFEPKDAFETSGAGAGAQGFFKDGEKRYRVLSITRADPDQARDVLQSIGKRKGAAREKEPLGDGAVRLMTGDADSPRLEWVVARAGKQLFGVGDEPNALKNEMSAADREKVSLSREQKHALLKSLLASVK